MKKTFYSLLFIILSFSASAQFEFLIETGINHVAHQWPDPMFVGGLFESSHWVANNIQFWTDDDYDTGSELYTNYLSIYDPNCLTYLDNDEFRIDQYGLFTLDFDYRVKLDKEGLYMRNGAGFPGIFLNSSDGNISARQSGGIKSFLIEADPTNPPFANTVSLMSLLDPADVNNNLAFMSVNVDIFNPGVYFSLIATDVLDADIVMAGTLNADVKNFSMPHPEKPEIEIWYACVEGPEAAAYERGTAKLVNGEAFVSFSDHYRLVANSSTMTVQVTPQEWDTYGVAVVEKTDLGFRVKELKGGIGNFLIDWEVKSVRKGYEDYQVERSVKESRYQLIENEKRVGTQKEKDMTRSVKLDTRKNASEVSHHASCVLHPKN